MPLLLHACICVLDQEGEIGVCVCECYDCVLGVTPSCSVHLHAVFGRRHRWACSPRASTFVHRMDNNLVACRG
jgi:hypothetical protein